MYKYIFLSLTLPKKCPYSELFWSVYSASLPIKSKCGKIRTKITLNTNTFHVVLVPYLETLLTTVTIT